MQFNDKDNHQKYKYFYPEKMMLYSILNDVILNDVI